MTESPGNKKIPRVLQSLCCWHTCLLDCSAFQDPAENCLFSEHLVDTLQPTSRLLTHLSHPKLPLSGLSFVAVTTWKGSCPNGRFSAPSPHCFAWSSVPAGLPLERAPRPFGSLSLPTAEAGKYLVLCSAECGEWREETSHFRSQGIVWFAKNNQHSRDSHSKLGVMIQKMEQIMSCLWSDSVCLLCCRAVNAPSWDVSWTLTL